MGVPPPLGAPGILAVCCHCRELELLDLGEVWGLEDSALVGFHDHQMEKLEKVSATLLVSRVIYFLSLEPERKQLCQSTKSEVSVLRENGAWSLYAGGSLLRPRFG